MISKSKKILIQFCSLFCFLIVWQILSLIVKSDLILPSPVTVFAALMQILKNAVFYKAFLFTFLRILAAFIISSILGLILGYLCSRFKTFDIFFEPFNTILRVTPVVAIILIVVFWFKSDFVPVFVSVLMTFPVMCSSVKNGFNSVPKNYLESAQVYNLSEFQTLFQVKIPMSKSFIYNGLISTFGLTWKVIVAGEVLCLPKNSIGYLLQKNNLHLQTANVFAVTVILVLVCFIIQKFLDFLLSCKEHQNKL